MQEETIDLIDRLLTNCIEEDELERAFTLALGQMTEDDRGSLAVLMIDRAKMILANKGIDREPTGVTTYLARKMAEAEDYEFGPYFEEDEGEPWFDGPFEDDGMDELVDAMMDNCVEEHDLSRLRGMDDIDRKAIADLIIARLTAAAVIADQLKEPPNMLSF